MEQDADISAALRTWRIRSRINQQALARTLGVSQSQVSRWESGRERPRAHNMDAIRALIWGRAEPAIAGLMHYVRGASAPLALFDSHLEILAASPFLRVRGGPLSHFGWLFDPEINPALPGLARRFRALARSEPVLVLEIPMTHENRPWACLGRLSVHRTETGLYALGEMSFVRDEKQKVREIALDAAARPRRDAGPDRA